VAAALLKESGETIVGLFLDLGPSHARAWAERVARRLEIDLHVLDLARTMNEEVIEPFLDLYALGLTPNPCAVCNRKVKFRLALEEAGRLSAGRLATGHYVSIDQSCRPPALLRGAEPGKEQSYFLARLERGWLDRLVFPLGPMTKAQVRLEAARLDLPNLARPESQEVCFLAGESYRELFSRRRPPRPGDLVDAQGRVLGRHRGLHAYTVGQRRGLGLAAAEPLYVLALDPERNRVVVGPEPALYRREASVLKTNWLVEPSQAPERVLVQVRYRAQPVPARLEARGPEEMAVLFERPLRAVAPGQLAAFYDGRRLLGGGWLR